jgi:hypothetical protein
MVMVSMMGVEGFNLRGTDIRSPMRLKALGSDYFLV